MRRSFLRFLLYMPFLLVLAAWVASVWRCDHLARSMPGRTVQAVSLDHHLIVVSHVGPNPDPLLVGLDNVLAERAAFELDSLGFRRRGFIMRPGPAFRLVVPWWSLALLALIPPCLAPLLLKPMADRRAARRLQAGHCPRCNYDLRATPERCPECGYAPA